MCPLTESPAYVPGKEYKFVVNSAEEAVDLIRKNLGEKAHVLAVNQLYGKGLARFLKTPKLEVVATVFEEKNENQDTISSSHSLQFHAVENTPLELSSIPVGPVLKNKSSQKSRIPFAYEAKPDSILFLESLLKKSGFSERMLASFKQMPEWLSIEDLPKNEGLQSILMKLTRDYQSMPKKPLTQNVAFLGCSGVGKTLLLCKQLAKDVFIHKLSPKVLKLDGDIPNSDEALMVFCNALGVEYIKSAQYLDQFNNYQRLYLDLAGPSLKDEITWSGILDQLDALNIDTRIWVIQAAYEDELIQAQLHLAHKMKSTHLALTHLDEVQRINKLWDYLFHSRLNPYIFSFGQNITGEVSYDILPFLIEKTFPPILLS